MDENTELVGKRSNAGIIIIICGGVLMIVAVVCFIASVLDEFDPEFLSTCIFMAVSGVTATGIGIAVFRKPKELILAGDTGFILKVQEKYSVRDIPVPYAEIVGIQSKHTEARIIFFMQDGGTISTDFVADRKGTVLRIAEIVFKKTGREIRMK